MSRILVTVLSISLISCELIGYILKDKMRNKHVSVVKMTQSPGTAPLTLTIAVTQNNLTVIRQMLMERSTPGNFNYQKWLTLDQIGAIIKNEKAYAVIVAWLSSYGVKIISESPRHEYITAIANISIWSKMFATTFHSWQDNRPTLAGAIYSLADQYYVPTALHEHIISVMGICQVPPIIHRHSLARSKTKDWKIETTDTTVAQLNSLYGISSNLGSSTLGQSVFETINQGFEQSDLNEFQSRFGLTKQNALVVGTTASNSCSLPSCGEGSLDIEFIMGVAQIVESTFWYVDDSFGDPFLGYLTGVAALNNPPSVLSISYGSDETTYSTANMEAFNTEAMKLGLAGITIFTASGDDGVAGNSCECSSSSSTPSHWKEPNVWSGEGYFPQFPASSPYVIAVGATEGPENGNPEVVCESDKNGLITSGGGFSTYFAQPSWQSAAVSSYLNSNAGQNAAAGYNPQGRGYPDIALIGVNYPIVVGSSIAAAYGTSASAPVAAAIVSLVNSKRQAAGLSTVGFINPTLYANPAFFNDITSGSNSCCAFGRVTANVLTCCSAGFKASSGWDPATGLGSISLDNLYSILTQDSSPNPTSAQSQAPTSNPSPNYNSALPPISLSSYPSFPPSMFSSISSPTTKPTVNPILPVFSTTAPSRYSSICPSMNPTTSPTTAPSVTPTTAPSTSSNIVPSTSPSIVPSTALNTSTNISTSTAHSTTPSTKPNIAPSTKPSTAPSTKPSPLPSALPSIKPSTAPSAVPNKVPSSIPRTTPTIAMSILPSTKPNKVPSSKPSTTPTITSTTAPTCAPRVKPSTAPSTSPSITTSISPSTVPSTIPSTAPSTAPSTIPSTAPSASPSTSAHLPTSTPSLHPKKPPTKRHSLKPTSSPSDSPSNYPRLAPSHFPTKSPTRFPRRHPSRNPTKSPTRFPRRHPSRNPTKSPRNVPTNHPRHQQSLAPTKSSPIVTPHSNQKILRRYQ